MNIFIINYIKEIKMKILLFTSIFFVIALESCVQAQEKKGSPKPTNECKYSCNYFIKLNLENVTIDAVKKLKVKAKYTYAESELTIAVLSRKKSWVVVEKNFGDKPTSFGVKHLIPKKDEAIQWFRNKKCKIGTVCPPNGDCWGSSSTVCYSDKTDEWVTQREFQFKGLLMVNIVS